MDKKEDNSAKAGEPNPNLAASGDQPAEVKPVVSVKFAEPRNQKASLPLTVQNSKTSAFSVKQVPTTVVVNNRDSYLPEPLRELILMRSLSHSAFQPHRAPLASLTASNLPFQ